MPLFSTPENEALQMARLQSQIEKLERDKLNPYRPQGYEHQSFTVPPAASAVGNYIRDVVTGQVAKRGLERLATDLNASYDDPTRLLDYVGANPMNSIGGLIGMTAFHGSPHKFAEEWLVELSDGSRAYVGGKYNELKEIPKDAKVVQHFPLGRFTDKAVGTGEGAQAYGHGVAYLAENKRVAKDYRDTLTFAGDATIDGKPVADIYNDLSAKVERLPMDEANKDAAELIYEKMSFLEDLDQVDSFKEAIERVDNPEVAKWAKTWESKYKSAGHIYEVDIPDEHIKNFLDWDAPLSEQPEGVRKALRDAGVVIKDEPDARVIESPTIRRIVKDALKQDNNPNNVGLMIDNDYDLYQRAMKAAKMKRIDIDESRVGDFIEREAKQYLQELNAYNNQTGEAVYRLLGDQIKATETLNSLGIKGIKYYDGGSRAAGEGTRNFVVFDEDIVKILNRE